MKKRFKYTIPTSEQIQNCKKGDFLLFEVKDVATDKIIISFYKNNDLSGFYWYNNDSKRYVKSCDYDFEKISSNRNTIRKRLYKIAQLIGRWNEPISSSWTYTCNVK